MFTSIPSLDSVLQCLLPAFTQPSFQTHIEVLLGWVMCLSKRTEYWAWRTVKARAYGVTRTLRVLSYQVVWPKVLGLRPILVVLVRDPLGKFKDAYCILRRNCPVQWA